MEAEISSLPTSFRSPSRAANSRHKIKMQLNRPENDVRPIPSVHGRRSAPRIQKSPKNRSTIIGLAHGNRVETQTCRANSCPRSPFDT